MDAFKPNSYIRSGVSYVQSGEFVPILSYRFSGPVSGCLRGYLTFLFGGEACEPLRLWDIAADGVV